MKILFSVLFYFYSCPVNNSITTVIISTKFMHRIFIYELITRIIGNINFLSLFLVISIFKFLLRLQIFSHSML